MKTIAERQLFKLVVFNVSILYTSKYYTCLFQWGYFAVLLPECHMAPIWDLYIVKVS